MRKQRFHSFVFAGAALGLTLALTSCTSKTTKTSKDIILLDNADRFVKATTSGNLMATAIQKSQKVDFVFLPSAALEEEGFGLLSTKDTPQQLEERVLSLYSDQRDAFVVGNMKWKDIKSFLLSRTVQTGRHDLHVAGMRYEIQLQGGRSQYYFINADRDVEDDTYYTVAVCQKDFRDDFPGYWYRNGMSFSFKSLGRSFDAKKALSEYLASSPDLRRFAEPRSSVRIRTTGDAGELRINQVQGIAHLSPYMGKQATIRGYVTGAARSEAGDNELYLQSIVSDQDEDPRTSEAVFVNLRQVEFDVRPKKGDFIQLTGHIYEFYSSARSGMTRTGIDQVTAIKKLSFPDSEKPSPVVLGGSKPDVPVPHRDISTHSGDLNKKPALILTDGIDFWESLEGMMVKLVRPSVVGLNGGKKDIGVEKSYINIFLTAEDTRTPAQTTPKGGQIIDNIKKDYNPEILPAIDHHFAPNVVPDLVFEVGDTFDYDITGILAYNINLFGDGQYVLYIDSKIESLSKIKPLADRPRTTLAPEAGQLTAATFNVENLAGDDADRIREVARGIATNLNCPDIVNLVEIQDANGESFTTASAQPTLDKLIAALTQCPHPVSYRSINIDPFEHAEGGQPGGNIRVAMIYNSLRVEYTARGKADASTAAVVDSNGRLRANPARIAPRGPVFAGTRRPLVAEFEFQGERLLVVGSHLNSKRSDTSLWSANQPPVLKSEVQRSKLAGAINDFCSLALRQDPNANILVMGDMNDFHGSSALKALEGNELVNLAVSTKNFGPEVIEANDFYTYNYGGNSQPLDFILGSTNLSRRPHILEIVHINTDYMAQIADHDPLVVKIDFN